MIDPTILVAIIAVALTAGIWIYNRLVRDRNMVANGWSDIDVQLMRRHDLIPQLVSAVQAYTDHEKATLQAVTELRSQSIGAPDLHNKATAEQAIAQGIVKLIAVAEDYPDLKADKNFRQLSATLVEIEDHLQYARRFYNGAVRILNTRIASFPHLLIAGPLGFTAAEFFSAEDAASIPPKVTLDKHE